jgi:hypothetical protein
VRFHVDAKEIAYLTEQSGEGKGVIYNPIVEVRADEDKTYEKYISGNAILPMK